MQDACDFEVGISERGADLFYKEHYPSMKLYTELLDMNYLYRIQTKDGKYKWYHDRGKITQYDQNGKPIFIAGIVFDITEKKEMQLELEYKNMILSEM